MKATADRHHKCTYSYSRHLIEGNVQVHVPTEFTLAKKIPVHVTQERAGSQNPSENCEYEKKILVTREN